jgi:DNA-binding GntR family transcriptional regulator
MFSVETSIHSEGIQHKSLVETIVENVEARILRGELKPGERLIEQAMCNQLQVSRSPLREAFRILENRGFLVNKARKGVFVSELSKKDAIDVYTIRANLESLAIYLAVKNDDGTLADRLQEINQKMLFFAEKGDAWNYAKCNQEFHSFLINSCNNQRLIGILEVFNKQTIRYRSEVMLSAGKMQDSIKKHEILIDSIRKKDAEQAEKIRKESILANIEIVSTLFL